MRSRNWDGGKESGGIWEREMEGAGFGKGAGIGEDGLGKQELGNRNRDGGIREGKSGQEIGEGGFRMRREWGGWGIMELKGKQWN